MADVRTCAICTRVIEQSAPITLCPKCGVLYHDECYSCELDCVSAECRADVASPTGESAASPPSSGRHGSTGAEKRAGLERAAIPNRVKSGEFTPEGLALDTGTGRATVSWDRIELITLGIIEEAFGDVEAQKSGLRSMVRKLFFGESQAERQSVRKVRDVLLLDVFVRGQAQPYRFDGATVNYRSFLRDVTYASARNFHRLVSRIVEASIDARLDASALAFVQGHREQVRRHGGVYDFELESVQNRERLHTLVPTREVRVTPPSPSSHEETP